MKIDKTVETPMGKVVFRGELSDEELDVVLTVGLVTMLIQGKIDASFFSSDGQPLYDAPEQVQ